MVYRFMMVYSNSNVEKATDFVNVYSISNIKVEMRGGKEMLSAADGKIYTSICETAMTIFLNKHINDANLKVDAAFAVKEDKTTKEITFTPLGKDIVFDTPNW